jgi:hypothetical protein
VPPPDERLSRLGALYGVRWPTTALVPLSRLSFPDLAHEYKKPRRTAIPARDGIALFPGDSELLDLVPQRRSLLVVPERLMRVACVLETRLCAVLEAVRKGSFEHLLGGGQSSLRVA